MGEDGGVSASEDEPRVDVVLANNDRVTMRVGGVFLKVDADQNRTDREVAAMELAPVPTPEVLWRNSPVLALAALGGEAIGDMDVSDPHASTSWRAAGRAVGELHAAPLPPWPAQDLGELASVVAAESDWLVANHVASEDVVRSNQRLAERALEPRPPVFMHGDLHDKHVFVAAGEVTGVIDWSEARRGDAMFDLASLTLAHPDRLGDVLAGYGGDVDPDLVRAWQSLRALKAIRWLMDNGYGPPDTYPEVALLHRHAR